MGIGRRLTGLGAGALTVTLLLSANPAAATSVWDRAMEAALQCVPFAREVSGVAIHGDAWTWWGQADGRYERGRSPRVGAVMAFTPHGGMKLGHVAVVRRLIGPREVRLDHSNWSLINGRRGQIERDVRAIDVSEANDWSRVRVWFGPIAALGGTAWPVAGFIYPAGGDARARIASSEVLQETARRRWATTRRVFSPAPVPPRIGGTARVVAAVSPPVAAASSRVRGSGAITRLLAWRTRDVATVAAVARPAAATLAAGKRPSPPTRSAMATSMPVQAPPGRRIVEAMAAPQSRPMPPRHMADEVTAPPSRWTPLPRPTTAATARIDAPQDLLALVGRAPARR